MSNNDLLMDGIQLMLIGMGIVFVFLVMLVAAITLMTKIINKYPGDDSDGTTLKKAPGMPSNKARKAAAISAALHHHNQSS